MCVAIAKKIGAVITDQVLLNCLRFNKDGFGVAYLVPNKKKFKIMIYKTLAFETFKKRLREIEEEFPESPMLIHFRAMSKGGVTIDNCHPFIVDANHVFIHNGTIGKAPADPKGWKSDTVMFNETIMQGLPKGWWGNPVVKELIEEYIVMSKLAMMNSEGDFEFFNEHKGTWVDNEIWYSNDQFKTPPAPKKKKHSHQQQSTSNNFSRSNTNSNYGNKDEYGEDVDWDLFSNECGAFHGQNRLNVKGNRYEKFDYNKKNWIDVVIWNNKYLGKSKPADDYRNGNKVYNYAMTMGQIGKAAKEAGVSQKTTEFTLKCTEYTGKVVDMSFTRCEFCWKPDYTESLFISDFRDSDESFLLCDECHHNHRINGALKEEV